MYVLFMIMVNRELNLDVHTNSHTLVYLPLNCSVTTPLVLDLLYNALSIFHLY